MSNKISGLINDPERLTALKEHLSLYALDEIAQLVTGDTVVNDGAKSSRILNSIATIDCAIIENSGDFLFSIKATSEQKQFAEFFPQMLPYNPWGVIDEAEHLFPTLHSVKVEEILWEYFYFSTADAGKQQLLWDNRTIKDKPALESLRQLSGDESDLQDEPLLWQGGLYYAGSFGVPWDTILPPEIPWNEFLPATPVVPVKGCVYQRGAMTFIKLTVDLLSKASPFGGDVIKNIALAFEFSSPFANPADSSALVSKDGERRIGLSGTIQIGDNTNINVGGSWPLDGDEILITANCHLSKIQSYFSSNSIEALALPNDAAADLTLSVSKNERTVNKIVFGLHLVEWPIAPNVFTLKEVDFGLRIFSPVTINLLLADVAAKAIIGSSTNAINLICSGKYPEGIYYLGLDKSTPVHLHELLRAITGIDSGIGDNLLLSELSGSYNAGANMYLVAATVSPDSRWIAGPQLSTQSGIALKNLSAILQGGLDDLFCSLKADFSITYSEGTMDFDVQCIYSKPSWFFSAHYRGNISMADVGNAIGFSNIPSFLSDCNLNALSLTYNTAGNDLSLSAKSAIKIDGDPLEANLFIDRSESEFDFSGQFFYKEQSLEFAVHKEEHKSSIIVTLNLQIAGVLVVLKADSESEDNEEGLSVSDKKFSGEAKNLHLSMIDSIRSLTGSDFEKPDWLPDIVITDLACSYDGGAGITTFTATADAAGHSVEFVFYKEKIEKEDKKTKKQEKIDRYAFGLKTRELSFGGLPVVGDVLKDVEIKDLGFVYASEAGKYELPIDTSGSAGSTVQKTKDSASKGDDEEKGVKYDMGFNFSGTLQLPIVSPFSLAVAAKDDEPENETPSPQTGSATQVTPTSNPASYEPKVVWFNLNKKLGPVTIDKVGFQIDGGRLGILINADVAAGPLIFSLTSLGISFAISELFRGEFAPSFGLAGLGLLYDAPPIEVGGSFLKVATDAGDEYNGTAIIKATDFTLSALGSYTRVNGDVSLFVYAYLEKAIGGPAFFYVEGLALGFGYNRRIVMPDISEVAHFPLVAQVMSGQDPTAGKSPAQVLRDELTSLDAFLPADPGEIFLVAGVKFNTFKLIDSFALLAISFGHRTEIDVLGQSNLVVPVSKDGAKVENPLAEIKILLAAKFLPDDGTLAIVARLSPDSYIFSKDCHLTGGAAFYSWFKGEHAGDFVVTMGGYHPHFIVPAHYPQVPRLALNWQISDNMSIKGDMYFALCPHAFMAGGHLQALYDAGDFKAWFKAGADFLITWQPYHYEASIYVDIGASLYVDLWFTSFTITVEYGADVEIWGPEFSGKATVHIYCFDITIRFGPSDSDELKPIDWDAFVQSSLPAAEKTIDLSIVNGEHGKDVFEKITYPIINPKELEFIAESVLPVTRFDDNIKDRLNGNAQSDLLQNFGIAPMAKNNTDIDSTFSVLIYYNEDEPKFEKVKAKLPENLVLSVNVKSVPASIWGTTFKHDLNEEQRLIEVVNGLRFKAKEPELSTGINYPRLQDIISNDNEPIPVNWEIPVTFQMAEISQLQSKLGL